MILYSRIESYDALSNLCLAWQVLYWRRSKKNLTLNLLTTTKVAPPSNATKRQMGSNSAFKGLMNLMMKWLR